jgi:hypothetical protein
MRVVLLRLARPRFPALRPFKTIISSDNNRRAGGGTGSILISGGIRQTVSESNIGSAPPFAVLLRP